MEYGQGANKSLRATSTATSSIHGQSSYLSHLDDDLLIEILTRIRSTRSVFQCKSVCKRWRSLISTHYFVDRFRFRAHQQRLVEHDDDDDQDQSLGIVVIPIYGMPGQNNPEVTIRAPPQNSNHGKSNNRAIVVLASCNDLILCHSWLDRERGWWFGCYYLCNPFTNQWFALPDLPEDTMIEKFFRFGLVCEYAADGYSIYRYRVVCFSDLGPLVWTYHSETCEWVESDNLCGKKHMSEIEIEIELSIVPHNGKLHWLNRNGSRLYTYDPFNAVEQERFSSVDGPCPLGDEERVDLFNLGECGGVLRVLATEFCPEGVYSENLKVWDLEEAMGSGRRRWSLKHNVPLKPIFTELCLKTTSTVQGVGIGLKKDVVFLQSCNLLVSYNFRNGEIKVEGQQECGGNLGWWESFFMLDLPWWPSTIPIINCRLPLVHRKPRRRRGCQRRRGRRECLI